MTWEPHRLAAAGLGSESESPPPSPTRRDSARLGEGGGLTRSHAVGARPAVLGLLPLTEAGPGRGLPVSLRVGESLSPRRRRGVFQGFFLMISSWATPPPGPGRAGAGSPGACRGLRRAESVSAQNPLHCDRRTDGHGSVSSGRFIGRGTSRLRANHAGT